MKKWMVLMVAVGFILTASVSVWSDAILFPWVVKNNAISTIISVVNTGNSGQIHFIYAYKSKRSEDYPSRTEELSDLCQETDFWVPTSPNDVVTFDAAGNFGKSSLFEVGVRGGMVGNVPITYPYGNLFLNAEPSRRAFLIVSDNTTMDDVLYGEAMVVDISIGAAWGYVAYNPRGKSNFDFADDANDLTGGIPSDQFGEVISGYDYKNTTNPIGTEGEKAKVVLMPPDVFKTKFFVTPISSDQPNTSLVTSVYFDTIPDRGSYISGIYDNDENPISSHRPPVSVVCTGALELKDLLSEATFNEFLAKKAQGWAYVSTMVNPLGYSSWLKPTTQAVIGKLEYSERSTTIGNKSVSGAINNFIWLRAHSR